MEEVNSCREAADKTSVSAEPHLTGHPAVHDVVEIIDRLVATRVSTIVESASDGLFVLRLTQATRVPDEAPVRWFDGATAWQAVARLEHIDAHRVSCQITPPQAWAPTSARRSLRTPTDESPLLVRIVSSSTVASGRRLHTTCLDISETGCRATWRGRPLCVGDAVDLSWDVAGSRGTLELGWVAARVTRVISLPSAATDVCFSFEPIKATQASRIRAWHQAWVHHHQSPSKSVRQRRF
jgi:hypothetical protein